jgi:hypothetical protein
MVEAGLAEAQFAKTAIVERPLLAQSGLRITWCKAWLNYSIAKNQTGLAETWASLE